MLALVYKMSVNSGYLCERRGKTYKGRTSHQRFMIGWMCPTQKPRIDATHMMFIIGKELLQTLDGHKSLDGDTIMWICSTIVRGFEKPVYSPTQNGQCYIRF